MTPVDPQIAKPAAKFRGTVRLLRGSALAVVLLATGLLVWNIGLTLVLRRALSPLHAMGRPITLNALDRDPMHAGAPNAAALYGEAFLALAPLLDSVSQSNDVPLISGKQLPPVGMPFEREDATRYHELLAPYEEALSLLHQGAKIGRCRYVIDRTQGYNRTLAWAKPLIGSVSVLLLRATLAADRGDMAASIDDLLCAMQLGESLREERMMYPLAVRLSCRALSLHVLEWCLVRGKPMREDAERLLAGLKFLEDDSALVDSFAAEQCITIVAISSLDQASDAFAAVDGGWSKYERRLFCTVGLDKLELLRFLRATEPMGQALQLPLPERLSAVAAVERTTYATIPPASLASGLLYPGGIMASMDCDRLARYRAATVGVRVLLLPEGAGDAALDELLQDPLLADPFSGQPLKLKMLDSGAMAVYSVGQNQVDDGGETVPFIQGGSAPDLVYQLPSM